MISAASASNAATSAESAAMASGTHAAGVTNVDTY